MVLVDNDYVIILHNYLRNNEICQNLFGSFREDDCIIDFLRNESRSISHKLM